MRTQYALKVCQRVNCIIELIHECQNRLQNYSRLLNQCGHPDYSKRPFYRASDLEKEIYKYNLIHARLLKSYNINVQLLNCIR